MTRSKDNNNYHDADPCLCEMGGVFEHIRDPRGIEEKNMMSLINPDINEGAFINHLHARLIN